jgi:hypothetical protein
VSRRGLIELAKRGWWDRRWVIQEVSLSPGRGYIQSGHYLSDFKNFRFAWKYLFKTFPELRISFVASMNMIQTIEDFRYSSVHDLQSPACENNLQTSNPYAPTYPVRRLEFSERLLRILLRTSGWFQCRDTRDHLHAVLGIAEGVRVGPRRNMAFFMKEPFSYLPIIIL